jgi:hypothetical protein
MGLYNTLNHAKEEGNENKTELLYHELKRIFINFQNDANLASIMALSNIIFARTLKQPVWRQP